MYRCPPPDSQCPPLPSGSLPSSIRPNRINDLSSQYNCLSDTGTGLDDYPLLNLDDCNDLLHPVDLSASSSSIGSAAPQFSDLTGDLDVSIANQPFSSSFLAGPTGLFTDDLSTIDFNNTEPSFDFTSAAFLTEVPTNNSLLKVPSTEPAFDITSLLHSPRMASVLPSTDFLSYVSSTNKTDTSPSNAGTANNNGTNDTNNVSRWRVTKKTSDKSSHSPPEVDIHERRRRNNIAARKYRQKKFDRIDELEKALADMTKERDELKLKCVQQEAEMMVFRKVIGNGLVMKR